MPAFLADAVPIPRGGYEGEAEAAEPGGHALRERYGAFLAKVTMREIEAKAAEPGRQAIRHRPHACLADAGIEEAYILSSLCSNFWLIFGKLYTARSRLYRSHMLKVNTRWKALDVIYKIYTCVFAPLESN